MSRSIPSTGDWSSYEAHLDQYITTNDVLEGRKVATLLTVIGSATYKLLENLLTPDQPATKSYAELIAAMKGHLSPKPLVIAERNRFHKPFHSTSSSASMFSKKGKGRRPSHARQLLYDSYERQLHSASGEDSSLELTCQVLKEIRELKKTVMRVQESMDVLADTVAAVLDIVSPAGAAKTPQLSSPLHVSSGED